jgi:hypothetical protein
MLGGDLERCGVRVSQGDVVEISWVLSLVVSLELRCTDRAG